MARRSNIRAIYPVLFGTTAPLVVAVVSDDVLQSIAVTFTDDGSSTTSGTTFRPTVGTQRARAVATGTYSVSGAVVITTQVTWTSGTVGTATISNGAGTEGYCTPVSAAVAGSGAAATTLITATLGAVSNNATLSVDVARDATSNVRCPVNAYQFGMQTGITMAGSDGIYLCQEASGNLANSGPGGPTLTANATPLYQQTYTGWTRVGVGANGGTNQRFTAAAAVGPSPASVDTIWCFFMSAPALPSSVRQLIQNGTNNSVQQINTSGIIRRSTPGNTADDSTTRPDVDDLVHPFLMLYDNTNTRTGVMTDEAKTLGTWAATTDAAKGLWAGTAPDAGCVCVYGFLLTAANARLNDAACKALLQSFGWTVPWS